MGHRCILWLENDSYLFPRKEWKGFVKISHYFSEREGCRLCCSLNVTVKSLSAPNLILPPSTGFGKSIVYPCLHGLVTQAPASYFCMAYTEPLTMRESCVLIKKGWKTIMEGKPWTLNICQGLKRSVSCVCDYLK